jgi:hypothetical protein
MKLVRVCGLNGRMNFQVRFELGVLFALYIVYVILFLCYFNFLAFSTIAEPFFPWIAASVLKSVLKNGKNQFAIDENRRDTYKHSLDSGHGLSILTNLEGELKQLMAVCISFFFFFFFFVLVLFFCYI